MKHSIGQFEVLSQQLAVSDPCYKMPDIILTVANGIWEAFIQHSDERVSQLIAIQNSNIDIEIDEALDDQIGVDSGQAGFFDALIFNQCSKNLYDDICDITLSEKQAGVIDQGAISSSGYGDGSYSVFVHRNKDGDIDAARIEFITDVEEDEDHNDEYYEQDDDWGTTDD